MPMKTIHLLSLPVIATLCVALNSLAAADPTPGPAMIHVTSVVDAGNQLLIKDGDSEYKVRTTLGQPDLVLPGGIWAYRGTEQRKLGDVRYVSSANGCDAMLLTFVPGNWRTGRTVEEIVLTNSSAIEELATLMREDSGYFTRRMAEARMARLALPPSEASPFVAHITTVYNPDGSVLIKDGDTEAQVQAAIGEPSEILPGEVWAYRRFERHNLTEVREICKDHQCDVMLVTFSAGRPGSGRIVEAITMVNQKSLPEVATNLKRDRGYLVARVLPFHQKQNQWLVTANPAGTNPSR